VTFVEVLKDRKTEERKTVLPLTTGDYLEGFLLATREALAEESCDTITITLGEVNAASIGMLIALYERAVGFYAQFIQVNAYHQPGVEAGKRAAHFLLQVQETLDEIFASDESDLTVERVEELLRERGKSVEFELVFKILEHLVANGRLNVERYAYIRDNRYAKNT
jgi:glucose-6-phosphate isomerase